MVTKAWEFTIENQKDFERLLEKHAKDLDSFSIPFRLMSSSWFQRRKQIFTLTSEGKYAPLGGFDYNSPSGKGTQTKRETAETKKERETGHHWAPILLGKSGKLKEATTGGAGSTLRVGKRQLDMGIDGRSVRYAVYHNSDKARKTLPQRKMVFLSGGKDKAQDAIVGNDIKIFTLILKDYVAQVLSGSVI